MSVKKASHRRTNADSHYVPPATPARNDEADVTYEGEEQARVEPFEALESELALLWAR